MSGLVTLLAKRRPPPLSRWRSLGVSYVTVRRDHEEALVAIRDACEKAGYGWIRTRRTSR